MGDPLCEFCASSQQALLLKQSFSSLDFVCTHLLYDVFGLRLVPVSFHSRRCSCNIHKGSFSSPDFIGIDFQLCFFLRLETCTSFTARCLVDLGLLGSISGLPGLVQLSVVPVIVLSVCLGLHSQ